MPDMGVEQVDDTLTGSLDRLGGPVDRRNPIEGLGGYAIATGLLTIYVAATTFRARAKNAAGIIAVTGITSIGWMALVNFVIDSDFKWLILLFALPWVVALALYHLESSGEHLSPA